MNIGTDPSQPDARAETLVAAYERAGYRLVAPAILQPAEPFLDLSGEDIRKRMYLTTDPEGRELCLRPDLTIPVSCDYLASPAGRHAGRASATSDPVFRNRGARRRSSCRPASSRSAGPTRPRPTPRCSRSASRRPRTTASPAPEIRMGDVGLFSALIAALDLAPAWKRRLVKDFNRKTSLAHDLDVLTLTAADARPEYQGVLAALAGSDPEGARTRWSPICCRSPASARSAAAPSARSPSASSSSPRSAPPTRCRARPAR